MADLAFLLLVFVAIAGIFSSARGISLQAPRDSSTQDLPAPDTPAVWVKVRPDSSILLNGTPVPGSLAVQAVRGRLAPYPEAVIVLHADPRTRYGAIADILAELLEDRSSPGLTDRRIAIPSREQVDAYTRSTGRDPFEEVR